MSTVAYEPAHGTSVVAEAHDLRVAGGPDGMPLGLVCRWPDGRATKGTVIFGHGFGESGRGYAGLSRVWAANGYLVIQPTFPDWIEAIMAADAAIARGLEGHDPGDWMRIPAMRAEVIALLHEPRSWLERIRIVRGVLDVLDPIMNATCGASRSRLPLAIAGHSFGAYVAQLFAGVEIDMPETGPTRYRDDRFEAAIVLSGQGRDQQGLRDGSWDGMTRPVLTVTGTLDGGARGQDWHWKCEPYDLAPAGGKYLAVLADAAHNLGGLSRPTREEDDPAQRDAVHQLTLAFLDSHLTGNGVAKQWLASVGDRVGECPISFKRK